MDAPIHVNGRGFFAALALLATAMADGHLSDEEIADGVDELVDTGPFDDYDDPFILTFVETVGPLAGRSVDTLRDLLDRNPTKIRERAKRVDAKGKTDKAERMQARADRVEARQAARGS